MIKNWICLLFTVLCLVSCKKDNNDATGGWEKVNNTNLGSNTISSIAFSGNTIFALDNSTAKTLYKSSDNGASWSALTNIPKTVVSVAALNSYVFVGTVGGVYRSADNGLTWNVAATGLPVTEGTSDGCFVFLSNNSLYTRYKGLIYKTNDGGSTWVGATGTLTTSPQRSILNTGFYIIVATDQGVYYSNNNGSVWRKSALDLKVVNAFLLNGETVIAVADNGIFYSYDNGASWTTATFKNETNKVPYAGCITKSGKNIYAGLKSDGVYISANYGLSWTKFNTGMDPAPGVLDMAVADGYLYIGTNGNGIWKIKL